MPQVREEPAFPNELLHWAPATKAATVTKKKKKANSK
jgi:hypothetical protein